MIPFTVQLLLLLSVGVSLAVAGYVWQARASAPGARPLLGMLLAVALWSASYLMQLLSPTLGGKLLWARFVAAGSILSVFAYFLFVVRYTGHDRSLTRPRLALLASVPVTSIAMAATNGAHELVWVAPRLVEEGGMTLLSTTKGPGFLLTIGYGYLLMVAGTLLVAELLWRSEEVYRGQGATILVATLVPWLGSTTFYGLPRAVTPLDPTPLLFSATGLVIGVALHRYHMFDLVPVAPDTMIAELRDAIVVLDDGDRVSHLNPAARRIFDVDGDAVGRPAADLVPDWAAVDPARAGTDRREEVALDVDGERRYFDLRASPLADYRDRPLGRLLVLRDVTERRERERQLEEYRTVFESVRDAVYVVDADGTIRLVNESLASMLGETPPDLHGRHVREVLGEDAYAAAAELLEELLADERTSAVLEFELPDATGETVPCETEVALLPTEHGFRGAVGTVRDISKRRRAQRSLAETTSTLETIFEASPLAVLTVDTDLEVTRWNPAAESMLGWATEEVLGRPFPPTDDGAEPVRVVCRRALDGETLTNHELALPTREGVDRQASLAAAPLESADGVVVGAVLVVTDITERKHREQQLDVLNRVLRHNLRNDLSVIMPNVELLRNDLPANRRNAIVDDVVSRAHDLVDYASKARQAEQVIDRGETRTRFDVADLAASTVDAARRRHPGASFSLSVAGAPAVRAQPTLDVALSNLLDNAVEHNDRDEPTVEVAVRETDDDGVAITVADDGPGIPADERQVLLTGEETPLHHGSGVGLWLVHWVVDRSGGELDFAENEPRGSVVTMRLHRAGTERPDEPESIA